MIPQKHLRQIIKAVRNHDQKASHQWFIFGSSLRKKHFGDIDLGVQGKIDNKNISALQETFENSTLPYKIDIIPFEKTSISFQQNVLNSPIKWIKR